MKMMMMTRKRMTMMIVMTVLIVKIVDLRKMLILSVNRRRNLLNYNFQSKEWISVGVRAA